MSGIPEFPIRAGSGNIDAGVERPLEVFPENRQGRLYDLYFLAWRGMQKKIRIVYSHGDD